MQDADDDADCGARRSGRVRRRLDPSLRRLVNRFRSLQHEVVIAPAPRVHETVADRSIPGRVEIFVVGRRRSIACAVNLVSRHDVLSGAVHDRYVHLAASCARASAEILQVSYLGVRASSNLALHRKNCA
jgi:hypothetical protein